MKMATEFEDPLDVGLVLGLGQYNIKNSFKNIKQTSNSSSTTSNDKLISVNDIHSTYLTLGLSSSPKSTDSSLLSHVLIKCENNEEQMQSRCDEDEELGRKKLRLSKEQSGLLEDKFKEHSTLNPKQKQALAKQLNLRPRQVEVWFQNRRARTKLKQTEIDREVYKKCYEDLTNENRRLRTELEGLKRLKTSSPLAMYVPIAPSGTLCPSCQQVNGASEGPFIMRPVVPRFLNNNSSALARPTKC